MRDGTRVYAQAGIGGMSENMTAFEEYCVPIFSDLPAAELTLLGDQQQAWDCTRIGGHVMLMGFTLQPVSFPGASLALLGRTIHPGQQGGLHVMRDIPRYVKLIEKGAIDAKR